MKLYSMQYFELAPFREELIWISQISRDIINLYFCLVMYSSLTPFLKKLPIRDEVIVSFERWLFGGNPLLALEPYISPLLTKVMVVAYLSFFLYLPVLVLDLLIRQKKEEMREFMASLGIALFLGYGGYILLPVVGPQVYQKNEFTVPLWKQHSSAFKETLQVIIDENRTPKDCFPSMHACLSTFVLIFAYRFSKKLFFIFLPGILLLILSTMYLRYHYVSDVIAGIALAFFSAWAGPRFRRHWELKHRDI